MPRLLHRTLPSDLDTPVAAYLRLAKGEAWSFLFESVEGGMVRGRYSLMGIRPDIIWKCERGGKVTVNGKEEYRKPLESLRHYLSASRIVPPENLPPMCGGGLFGYLGYDFIHVFEDIPDNNPDTLAVPDGLMFRPTLLAVFDSFQNSITLAAPVWEGTSEAKANALLDMAAERLSAPFPPEPVASSSPLVFPDAVGQ